MIWDDINYLAWITNINFTDRDLARFEYAVDFLLSVYSSFKWVISEEDIQIDDKNMEGRKTTDINLSYRWGKKFQSGPQVKRHVCQWTKKGITAHFFTLCSRLRTFKSWLNLITVNGYLNSNFLSPVFVTMIINFLYQSVINNYF